MSSTLAAVTGGVELTCSSCFSSRLVSEPNFESTKGCLLEFDNSWRSLASKMMRSEMLLEVCLPCLLVLSPWFSSSSWCWFKVFLLECDRGVGLVLC